MSRERERERAAEGRAFVFMFGEGDLCLFFLSLLYCWCFFFSRLHNIKANININHLEMDLAISRNLLGMESRNAQCNWAHTKRKKIWNENAIACKIIVMTFVQFTCLWMMRRVCQRQKVRREREKESVFMRHLNCSCQLSMHTRGQTNRQTFNRHIYAHNPKEKTILWIRISSPRIRNKLHTRTHEHTRRSHDFGLLARLWLFCCHHSAHAAQARVVHSRTAFSLRMAVLFSLFNRDDDDSSHTQSYGEVHTRARKNKCVHVCECVLFFSMPMWKKTQIICEMRNGTAEVL